MAIGIERFRQITGDRITQNAGGTAPQKSELSLGTRLKAWSNAPAGDKIASFRYGTAADRQANVQFKGAFLGALTKAEGLHTATRAARAAGLPADWNTNPTPIGEKTIRKVLDKAQEFRKSAVDRTAKNVTTFQKNLGAPSFTTSFQARTAAGNLPPGDAANPQLRRLFEREVKQDALYAKRPLDAADLDRIAGNAINKFYAGKAASFREAHPGLANYAQSGHIAPPRSDARGVFAELTARLSTNMAGGHALATEGANYRDLAQRALVSVEGNATLLGRMAYEPAGWNALRGELTAKHTQLHQLENQIAAEHPATPEGQALQQDLVAELRHQQGLVIAKRNFLDDVASKDPLSQKSVAYSNKLWAEAAGHVFDEAIELITNDPARGPADPAIPRLQTAKNNHIASRDVLLQAARTDQRTADPAAVKKKEHPATQAKDASVTILKRELDQARLSDGDFKRLTGSKNMGDMRRKALNANPDWAPPAPRRMVVTKDGVTRTYESRITYGADISPRFARRFQAQVQAAPGVPGHDRRAGIASATKADHYHARNLKVSELAEVPHQVGPGAAPPRPMAKVVGHGVLDMWDITNPVERRSANTRGAHEVLEAAITTNDRVRTEALTRAANGNTNPVKLTHVSVNLTTPASWREGVLGVLPALHDYQELTYTQEQFRAFAAHSRESTGQSTPFRLDDDRAGVAHPQQNVPVNVDVDVISFSFAINPLATGESAGKRIGIGAAIGAEAGLTSIVPGGTILGAIGGAVLGGLNADVITDRIGGWPEVYAHNQAQMTKFVGDLGTGKFGAEGSRPGGFIGSAYDRLDAADPQQAALMNKIRVQTDTVRSLFTHEDFKRGNGDPAKMGREILALQGLAEDALGLVGANDQAATMSKGCKSDKDRGGVTDVELKHKLITEDMGGEIVPDRRLEGDDQESYYVVASSSGQLENQALNTGLPGSKEAGKLTERIPSAQVRQYLAGLGSMASE